MRLIAQFLDSAFAPLLRRMERRLHGRFQALHAELAAIKAETAEIHRFTYRPNLSERFYAEMANIASLPYALLGESKGPVGIVGLQAKEVAPHIPQSVVLPWGGLNSPHPVPQTDFSLQSMLLLDEHALLETVYSQLLTPRHIAEQLIFPTRNLLLPESTYRTILHQAGFIEICRAHTDPFTAAFSLDAISHTTPMSCAPYYLAGAPEAPDDLPVWLVASRHTKTSFQQTAK